MKTDVHRFDGLTIPADDVDLVADLVVPEDVCGVVLFAHGSGSTRFSVRNGFVAETLEKRRVGTLRLDLLTAEEERRERAGARRRFDILLLARRLDAVTGWLRRNEPHLPLGYFGASTGAAAALTAAAARNGDVAAVVSRGGRPDLAEPCLESVTAPTLLIVGSLDTQVIEFNREALARLRCPKELAIVRGATHLFPEPGTLEQVAHLAGDWFVEYLAAPGLELSQ